MSRIVIVILIYHHHKPMYLILYLCSLLSSEHKEELNIEVFNYTSADDTVKIRHDYASIFDVTQLVTRHKLTSKIRQWDTHKG
jgi:hypothetical protein